MFHSHISFFARELQAEELRTCKIMTYPGGKSCRERKKRMLNAQVAAADEKMEE